MNQIKALFEKAIAYLSHNGRRWFTLVTVFLILMVLLSSVKWGCDCGIKLPLPPPVTTVRPDTTKPITVKPTSFTYTPKPTAQNPKPTPVTVPKPIEGKVSIQDDTAKIQNLGLCLVPKAGYSTEGWYGGARVLFWGQFGLEVMANERRAFLGVDYRLFFLNQITVAAGGSAPYQVPVIVSPYAGASVCLAQW